MTCIDFSYVVIQEMVEKYKDLEEIDCNMNDKK